MIDDFENPASQPKQYVPFSGSAYRLVGEILMLRAVVPENTIVVKDENKNESEIIEIDELSGEETDNDDQELLKEAVIDLMKRTEEVRLIGTAWLKQLRQDKYAELIGQDIETMVLRCTVVLSDYDIEREYEFHEVNHLEQAVKRLESQYSEINATVDPFLNEWNPKRNKRTEPDDALLD